MITAHLPSGYIVGRHWPQARWVLPAAVFGGVFPDLDLIWFYLIDNRAFHHHHYWVHAPGFWSLVSLVLVPLAIWQRCLMPVLAFLAAIFVHILLDSLTGGVMWLWPFSTQLYHLVTVPAVHSHWVLNFLLHWTMAFEIAIWLWAGTLLFKKSKRASVNK